MVAESVVVIKKLLQTQPGSHGEIVGQMARLVGRITVPQARAAILWLVGEHCDKKGVSKIAPDVLRVMAKSFSTEVCSLIRIVLLLACFQVSRLDRYPFTFRFTQIQTDGLVSSIPIDVFHFPMYLSSSTIKYIKESSYSEPFTSKVIGLTSK